jgi:hypothetical protein
MTLPEFPEPVSSAPVTAGNSPPRQGPLKFEAMLVPRLRAAHAALNKRFAELIAVIERDPAATGGAIEDCARQFSAVRHIETIWLYPLLARAVEGDAVARGQLMELRLVGLMLARRVQRYFDDLLQAVRAEVFVADTAAYVAATLTRYSRHSEHSVYPLYELIGAQSQESVQVA